MSLMKPMWDAAIRENWNGEVSEDFLATIWETSTETLPGLEVQVVVDSSDTIHVSKGSPGYVDFKIDPVGMKLPIKCWIHTHPFGHAYWSGIDWSTIDTWRPFMKRAIVLGKDQRGMWTQGDGYTWTWQDTANNEIRVYAGGGLRLDDGRRLNDVIMEEE